MCLLLSFNPNRKETSSSMILMGPFQFERFYNHMILWSIHTFSSSKICIIFQSIWFFYLYRKISFVFFILEKYNTQPIPGSDSCQFLSQLPELWWGKDKKLSLRLGWLKGILSKWVQLQLHFKLFPDLRSECCWVWLGYTDFYTKY